MAVLLCASFLNMQAVGATADIFSRKSAHFTSNAGTLLYLGAGVALPLLEDGRNGRDHSLRVLDSLGTSVLITEGLKSFVRELRPNGTDYESFPSGHAAAAFAVATVESSLHPKQTLLWVAGASLIGVSRVRLDEHYAHDVLAGAAIGYLTARWELSRPRGLLLAPFISGDHGGGLSVRASF